MERATIDAIVLVTEKTWLWYHSRKLMHHMLTVHP